MLKQITRRVTRRLGVEVTRPARRRGLSLFADLQRLLPNNAAPFFDVGANVGAFTRDLAAAFPDRTIYACEPVPATARQLRKNVAAMANVRVVEAAFGDRCGEAKMRIAAESVWNHLTTEDVPDQTVAVELVTVDAVCEREKIGRVGLLKTDCEGYDLAAVRGANRMLSAGAVDAVYCEVGFRRDGKGNDFYGIDEYLAGFGFHFYAIYDYSGPGPTVAESFANALWVPAGVRS
jgi:FkbM family methyltransferase